MRATSSHRRIPALAGTEDATPAEPREADRARQQDASVGALRDLGRIVRSPIIFDSQFWSPSADRMRDAGSRRCTCPLDRREIADIEEIAQLRVANEVAHCA